MCVIQLIKKFVYIFHMALIEAEKFWCYIQEIVTDKST